MVWRYNELNMSDEEDNDERREDNHGQFISALALILLLLYFGKYIWALWTIRVLIGCFIIIGLILYIGYHKLPNRKISNEEWYLGAKNIEMQRPLTPYEYDKEKSKFRRSILRFAIYFGVLLTIYMYFFNK